MEFDLKQFRCANHLKQNEFAEMVNYKQPILSRMENGDKSVSDRLLMRIEDVFKINLDEYKKFKKNKRGLYLNPGEGKSFKMENTSPLNAFPHSLEHGELRGKYQQLLVEKSEADERYFALDEEHKQAMHELSIVHENNILLRKLATDMQELMMLLKGQRSGAV